MLERAFEKRHRVVSPSFAGASLLLGLLLLVATTRLPAGDEPAKPQVAPAAEPSDVEAPTDEDLLRHDLKRLVGRWMRTVPGPQALREVLTIDGEHDSLDVLNSDGAVISRYTSRFTLERAGDVRIYNRSDVNLVKGNALFRSGAETQSFIVQFTRGGFYEVTGALNDRNGSLQRHAAILWKEIGVRKPAAEDAQDAENDDAAAEDERPAFEPPAAALEGPELKRDLELLQGSWVLVNRNAEGQVTSSNQKTIEGNTERLTYSDADGKVTYEHTVKFRLEKYGPVRIFHFYDMTPVIGPGAGVVSPDAYAFVYKVDNDKFLDCPGTFVSRTSYRNDPAVIIWRRPESPQEVNAEIEIEQLGGSVVRSTRGDVETISIRLNGAKVGDEQLKLLKAFKKLNELALIGTQVTDAGMKEVAQCANLTRLELRGAAITDAGVKEIAGLEKLKFLSLERTQVTDAGLAMLTRIKDLRQLYLGGTKIGDTGARELAKLQGLTHLGIIGTKITDAGFAALSDLEHLTTLNAGGRGITDASVAQFVKFKHLAELRLENTQLTDAGLQKIKAALPETNVHR